MKRLWRSLSAIHRQQDEAAPVPSRAPRACQRVADRQAVATAADRLGISEFELFGAAYLAWYDERVSEQALERHFVVYLFDGIAPFWVRHFARLADDESAARLTRACIAAPSWTALTIVPVLALSDRPRASGLVA